MDEEKEISNFYKEDVVVHSTYYYIKKYEKLFATEEIANLKTEVLTGGRRKTKRKKTKRKKTKRKKTKRKKTKRKKTKRKKTKRKSSKKRSRRR